MDHFAGLDVSVKETSICIRDRCRPRRHHRILSCNLFCMLCSACCEGWRLERFSFSRVLMTFAVVSALGIVLQVDAAGVGPDQKADAPPSDPATLATIKTAIALARKGELAQASDVKESMSDPIARNVVEWAILRSKEVDFQRYVAFISEVRAGRISVCCADALRRRSGRNGSIRKSCAGILAQPMAAPALASNT